MDNIEVFHDPVLDEDVVNQVKLFGGVNVKKMTTDERLAMTPAEGELIYDSDLEALYVGDGVTAGGVAVGGGGSGTINYADSAGSANLAGAADSLTSGASVNGATVTFTNIPQSAVTNLTTDLAGKQPAISSGATMDINITGNAATATTAVTAATATNAMTATNATSAASAGYAASAGTAGALAAGVVVASASSATTAALAGSLSEGVVVASASSATTAGTATNATSATNAGYATSAGTAGALATGVVVASASSATTAGTATNATSATYLGGATKAQIISSAVASASGGGVAGNIATVENVMTGVTGGTQTIVDVASLRGGLTAGQAVDVTSEPDGFATRASGGGYRDTFTWNFDGHSSFGFASFPKFAAGLKYLMICDVTPAADMTVMPFGRWIDEETEVYLNLASGTTTRLAFIFDHAEAACLQFTNYSAGVTFSNVREYEVTACSDDAIAYIAALSNPDEFQDYYLVKRDMVSPWTYIIDMGNSPATTVAAGLAYKIDCTSGSHIITVDTCPAGFVGRETYVRLLVGNEGSVVVQSPLKLATPLTPNAINNCTVQYRDGEAILSTIDILGGYIVDASTGTTNGTLYYGLSNSDCRYITFSPALDDLVIDAGGAVVVGEKNVVGNGFNTTTISGSFYPTSQTQFNHLGFGDTTIQSAALSYLKISATVQIKNGATMTMSGATVCIHGGTVNGTLNKSGGTLLLSSAYGSGAINLAGGNAIVSAGARVVINGLTLSGGSAANGGAILVSKGGTLSATSCSFTSNTATNSGGAIYNISGSCVISNCAFIGNNAATYGLAVLNGVGGAVTVANGSFGTGQSVTNVGAGAKVMLVGSCSVGGPLNKSGAFGELYISAGAVIDATGNTNNMIIIQSASGCKVGSGTFDAWVVGGTATFITSAGNSVVLEGTFTQVTKAGAVS